MATQAVFAPWLMLFLILVPMTVACALGANLFHAQHDYPLVKLLEGMPFLDPRNVPSSQAEKNYDIDKNEK